MLYARFNNGFSLFFDGETKDHSMELAYEYAKENNLSITEIDFGYDGETESYRFEWNFHIESKEDYNDLVTDMATNSEIWGINYEQAARLFYFDGNGNFVMIELQVPTYEMISSTEEDEKPWLDAYEVKAMDDYDASNEIATEIGSGIKLTYENAMQEMLRLARECCE